MLEGVEGLLDEERQARVQLEDTLQELEVSVHTNQEETAMIQQALQQHADAIDAVSAVVFPDPDNQNPRLSMRPGAFPAYEEEAFEEEEGYE